MAELTITDYAPVQRDVEANLEDVVTVKYHLSNTKIIRTRNCSIHFNHEDLEIYHSNAEHEETVKLAQKIFRQWDHGDDGVISVAEIKETGMTQEFAEAFARLLDYDKSGNIRIRDLIDCITVLKHGTLKSKVAMLMNFMDHNGDGVITYEQAQLYLKTAPQEICQRLGLTADKTLTYLNVLALFQNSDRGEEAINIFCSHILTTLQKDTERPRTFRRGGQVVVCTSAPQLYQLYIDTMALVKKLSTSAVFIASLAIIQAVLFEYNYQWYRDRDYPYAFCVAKGFGMNLRILTILLFLTMARTTMGFLHKRKFLRIFVPMGFNIQIHSFIGFCTCFHALGHTCGHIVFHQQFVDGGFKHVFEQKSILRGVSWRDKGTGGDGITGALLLASLAAMAFTALKRGDSPKWYRVFSCTHFLYCGWLILIFLHVPHLWPYFLSIGLLMLLERGYDFLFCTLHSTLATSRPTKNGVTFISVQRSGGMPPPYPGSYYRIKVPSLSAVEWHPFSLAGGSTSHHLNFFVASSGDWTSALYELVSDSARRETATIQVSFVYFFFLI